MLFTEYTQFFFYYSPIAIPRKKYYKSYGFHRKTTSNPYIFVRSSCLRFYQTVFIYFAIKREYDVIPIVSEIRCALQLNANWRTQYKWKCYCYCFCRWNWIYSFFCRAKIFICSTFSMSKMLQLQINSHTLFWSLFTYNSVFCPTEVKVCTDSQNWRIDSTKLLQKDATIHELACATQMNQMFVAKKRTHLQLISVLGHEWVECS